MDHQQISKIPNVLKMVGLCLVWQMLCVGMVWATPVKSEVGAPPPPADNEIPPAPPAFRPYQRPQTTPPQQAPNSWYGSPEYRRWLQYRKRKFRRYRKYRRQRTHQNLQRPQFWWSTEGGLYLASFSPLGKGTRSMDFMGLMTGAQIGVRYRSVILSVGAGMAFSLFDDNKSSNSLSNVGGSLARLSGSLGWALGKFIVLESGMSMEYLSLKQGSWNEGALLFPFHVGLTLRIPIGLRYAIGLRTTAAFAFEPSNDGFYFSVTSNLVFQTQ